MAIVLVMHVLASCGGGGESSGSEPPLGEVLINPAAAELTLPLDAYQGSGQQRSTLRYAENLVLAECLGRQGVQWDVQSPNPRDDARINDGRYGLIGMNEAQQYGYMPPPDPEGRRRLEASQNDRDVPNHVFHPCLDEAQEAVGTDTLAESADSLLDGLGGDSWDASEADSRVQEAFGEWSECMADAGYPDAEHPFDFSETVTAPRREGGNGDASTRPVVSEEERAAAVADVTCKEEVNLVGIWFAVETAYQNRTIEENAGRFEERRAQQEAAMEQAADVIERLGGPAGAQG